MNGRTRWRPAFPLLALGLAIVGLAGVHVVLDDDALLPELLDAGILVVFAVAVLAVGVRVATDRLAWAAARRVLAFTVGSSLVVGGLSAVFILSRGVTGEQTSEQWFFLFIGVSVGAATGALVGYYLNRYETSLRHEAELSRRLTVLQRVLRHNIRNEVTIIEGLSRELAERSDDPEITDGLHTITDHIGRLHRVAEKSQDLAAVWQTDGTVSLDAARTFAEAVDRVSTNHPEMTVSWDLPDSLTVDAHPRIGMAFEELLDNAARHNETVTVDVRATIEDSTATLRFADTGGGIPESEIAPLVRGHERPLDHTTGIGLWFVYWLVDHSNGDLSFSEREEGGAIVEITLPTA